MAAWRAPFQRWFESDFFGSVHVRRMPAIARLMYRSLLQGAWHSDNPPYLPNDDETLMIMADAPSPEDWTTHRALILERFHRSEDGQLYHPKALAEYNRALSEHEQKADAGRRRWGAQTQTHAKPAPANHKGKTRKTPLPENFGISDRVRKWATEKGYTRLEEHLESFTSYAKRKGAVYADWDEAFMTAIRENWGKLSAEQPEPEPFDVVAHTRELMKG